MQPGIWSVTYRIHGAAPEALESLATIEQLLAQAASRAGLSIVSSAHHRFAPQGISAVLILSESHIAAHTWPEHASAYVTITSCRALDPDQIEAIGALITQSLEARGVESRTVSL